MKKTVDYIIKTHNELPYLRMMLWSLKNNNPSMWDMAEIKVFANRCTDGTKQWCDANGIWCEEVDLPGLYSIWNHGTSITKNHILIFSASDFVLAPGFWSSIVEVAINSAIHKDQYYHFSGTCIDNGVSYPHPDIVERRWYNRDCGDNWKDFDYKRFLEVIGEIGVDKKTTPNETSYCPFLTSREHYDFLNGFNTALGDYPTDIDHDFLRRGKEAGRECAIVDKAFFYHFGKKSLLRRDGADLDYNWKRLGGI